MPSVNESLYDHDPSYFPSLIYETEYKKSPNFIYQRRNLTIDTKKFDKWIQKNFDKTLIRFFENGEYEDDDSGKVFEYYTAKKEFGGNAVLIIKKRTGNPTKKLDLADQDSFSDYLEKISNKKSRVKGTGDKYLWVALASDNEQEAQELRKVLTRLHIKENVKNKIYMLKITGYGTTELDEFPIPENSAQINLTDNYGNGFPPIHDKIKTMLETKKSGLYIFHGPPGTGKCLGKGTPILMFDGTVKLVENIKNGELIMGPDSLPRKVSGCITGKENLYKVIPRKGEPYVVNESHILSLKWSGMKNKEWDKKGKILNISVKDYLKLSNNKKHHLKGWRSECINFPPISVPLDPYFLGLWLGDGCSAYPNITTGDAEVMEFLRNDFLQTLNDPEMHITEFQNSENSKKLQIVGRKGRRKGGEYPKNKIMDTLSDLNLLNNKHIPDLYKMNDRKTRLELLAGLIDSDGEYSGGFYITQKNKTLAEDILFLARSLGFAAYLKKINKHCYYKGERKEGEYYRISISGNLEYVPTKIKRKQASKRLQKKNVLVTSIQVIPHGYGEYFGFELDNDGLFCLGDFTVTHNTSYVKYLTTCGIDRKIIFVPNTMVAELFSPKMVETLFSFKDSILVLEDAEICVLKRDGTNNELVSGLLNITDGLLKDLLNISIIITFNSADIDEMDKALLRKGRLYGIHKFDLLKKEEAQKLAKILKRKKEVTGPLSLADIYNLDEETGLEEFDKPVKIGFGR